MGGSGRQSLAPLPVLFLKSNQVSELIRSAFKITNSSHEKKRQSHLSDQHGHCLRRDGVQRYQFQLEASPSAARRIFLAPWAARLLPDRTFNRENAWSSG